MGCSRDPTSRHLFSQRAVVYATFVLILPIVSAVEINVPGSSNITRLIEFMSHWLQRRNGAWAVLLARITRLSRWDVFIVFGSCAVFTLVAWKRTEHISKGEDVPSSQSKNRQSREPTLLKNNSSFQTYRTSKTTYPAIRTFYHQHPQAEKLPTEPQPLPVLVFIHGLGGSLAQFHPLLTSLTNVAPCFGIDLPGCGQSEFSPRNWDAYSHSALVELLDVVISDACDRAETQEAVLICHSMGCSLATSLLARGRDGSLRHADKVGGLIAICPKASLPTPRDISTFRRLLNIPSPLFDLFRAWDRRGGIQSASVSRFVGDSASIETRKLQLRFNEQSKTDVWRRMAWGAVPVVSADGTLHGGLPGPDAWARIAVPVFLIAGEADQVTKPKEIAIITKAMGFDADAKANSTDNGERSSQTPAVSGLKSAAVKLKTTILPAPAAHGLLYDHSTYRTVSGLILTFLSDHIQPRLSMGWQLQHLKESNKWDVKNLAKWQAVIPVSGPIANIFRATKTLRESDEQHSPSTFVARWGNTFKAVIDISHDSPVYNPHDLEKGGIEYHKFPTVSKIPPTREEVRDFIALVDQLRLEEKKSERGRAIGVHCHYGFNRTGFFICSYLIEREGYGVQRAVDEFATARPPGIRHEHFLDTLFVRYCVGLKRSPTM